MREGLPLSHLKVKDYLESVKLGDRHIVWGQVSDTVESAAKAVGCEPAQIVKTMSFLQSDGPVVIAIAGDAKVNSGKYKATFQQKAVMIPGDQVEELTGFPPGAVCPFALKEGVKVYLDTSTKRFDIIHVSGGSIDSTVELSLAELEKHSSSAGWVDVCKGWYGE